MRHVRPKGPGGAEKRSCPSILMVGDPGKCNPTACRSVVTSTTRTGSEICRACRAARNRWRARSCDGHSSQYKNSTFTPSTCSPSQSAYINCGRGVSIPSRASGGEYSQDAGGCHSGVTAAPASPDSFTGLSPARLLYITLIWVVHWLAPGRYWRLPRRRQCRWHGHRRKRDLHGRGLPQFDGQGAGNRGVPGTDERDRDSPRRDPQGKRSLPDCAPTEAHDRSTRFRGDEDGLRRDELCRALLGEARGAWRGWNSFGLAPKEPIPPLPRRVFDPRRRGCGEFLGLGNMRVHVRDEAQSEGQRGYQQHLGRGSKDDEAEGADGRAGDLDQGHPRAQGTPQFPDGVLRRVRCARAPHPSLPHLGGSPRGDRAEHEESGTGALDQRDLRTWGDVFESPTRI